jgi:hypothetical protein
VTLQSALTLAWSNIAPTSLRKAREHDAQLRMT